MANIGFVGLGHMGLPMAINLIKKGHKLTGYDLQSSAMNALSEAGGKTANNLQELSENKDILITMLQTGQQVLHVSHGVDGLFNSAKPDTLYIDCSTIDVESARKVHQHASESHFRSLEAPVSGGVAGAIAGTLTFMVGGDEKTYQDALPILSCMGQKIIHTGGAGSGQAAKICNNMVLGISMTAISEAFTLAHKLGLSEEKLFEVVTNASGQCWAMSKYVPVPNILENVPANKDYQPGFAANMMLKDLVLSQDAADSVHIQTPLGAKTTAIYQRLIDNGMGDLDFSAVIKLIEKYQGD